MASYIIPGFYSTGSGGASLKAPTFSTQELPVVVSGQEYSATIVVKGTAPITVSTTSTLPTGLSFDSSTNTISGTTTQTGTFPLTFTATNAVGSAEQEYSLLVATLPSIDTDAVPEGWRAVPYSFTIQMSGTGPIEAHITAGALPDALVLNTETHAITGIPASVSEGNHFTITATNVAGSVEKEFTIDIFESSPSIRPATLPNATYGSLYNEAVTSSGYAPIDITMTGGELPDGLSYVGTNITGTPTEAGTFNPEFTAENGYGTDVHEYTFVVDPIAPEITSTSLPTGTYGQAYDQTIGCDNGGATVTWEQTAGTLLPGLAFDTTLGRVYGTPAGSGTREITVTATNSVGTDTQVISITINAILPTINTETLPNGTVETGYNQTLSANGGGAVVTWGVSDGNLPDGLTLTSDSGVISGVPTTAGTSTFTISATNTAGTTTKQLSITVDAIAPEITTSTLPAGTYGQAYNQTLACNNGGASVTWTVTVGNLPGGLNLNSSSGLISGTPIGSGVSEFTVTCTNSAGSDTAELSITINAIAPTITTTSLPNGTIDQVYNQTLAGTNGGATVTWSVSEGNLPNGLNLASSTGVISGTPTATGSETFTVTATNSAGSATKELSITIDGIAPEITTTTIPEGTVNAAYDASVTATGTAPITYATESALPDGITFTNGAFTGTPTVAFSGTVTVTATNQWGSDSQDLTLTIADATT